MVKVYLDNETKELQKNSKSKSTKRSYENDWIKFTKYCEKYREFNPLDVDDDDNSVYSSPKSQGLP